MHINSDKFKIFGNTSVIECPKCKDKVNMQILKSTSALGALGIPLFEYQVELFTVCPSCGSVFSIDKDLSKACGKDKADANAAITADKLKYMTCINPEAYKK